MQICTNHFSFQRIISTMKPCIISSIIYTAEKDWTWINARNLFEDKSICIRALFCNDATIWFRTMFISTSVKLYSFHTRMSHKEVRCQLGLTLIFLYEHRGLKSPKIKNTLRTNPASELMAQGKILGEKNNELHHEGSNGRNIKNTEPRPKFNGSYKKRVYSRKCFTHPDVCSHKECQIGACVLYFWRNTCEPKSCLVSWLIFTRFSKNQLLGKEKDQSEAGQLLNFWPKSQAEG